jgi:hypothetical protein
MIVGIYMLAVRAGHTNTEEPELSGLDRSDPWRGWNPRRLRAPRGQAMSRAVGWALTLALVLLLGTHPGSVADLLQHALAVLQRAGAELASFVNKL